MSDIEDIPPELLEAMSPKELEELLMMLNDITALGPQPTRKLLCRTLLPYLNNMFGNVEDTPL